MFSTRGADEYARSHASRPDAQDPQHVIALTLDVQAKRVIIIQSAQQPSVSLIDATQGTFIANTPIDGVLPYAVAVSERLGRIFVAHWDNVQHEGGPNGPGMVDVLRVTNGAILAGVPVGFGPIALAVDDMVGRVVVVDQGGLNQDGSSNGGDVTLFDATITE